MFDLHVSAEVPLQVELARAVRTLEGFAASVEVHVAEEVVHSVEGLAAYLRDKSMSVNVSGGNRFPGRGPVLRSPCI